LLEWWDIVLRLGVATLASGAIGLNRDLHGKPIGLRTLGMVGLATALVVLIASPASLEAGQLSDATSRVVQGILTGIGFLGAGVIVHSDQHKVKGLTSAACVWFTACI
jgi:putative Mg2+ transporter-C (MgtC) family protein